MTGQEIGMEKFFKVREKSGKWKVLDAKSGKIGIMLAERFHVTVISSHAEGQKDGCSVGTCIFGWKIKENSGKKPGNLIKILMYVALNAKD